MAVAFLKLGLLGLRSAAPRQPRLSPGLLVLAKIGLFGVKSTGHRQNPNPQSLLVSLPSKLVKRDRTATTAVVPTVAKSGGVGEARPLGVAKYKYTNPNSQSLQMTLLLLVKKLLVGPRSTT